MTSHTTSAYDCTANGSGLAANGTALKSVSNGSGGHPNYGATVIDSRAVDYLLMKLRSKNTKGKVRILVAYSCVHLTRTSYL